MTTCVSAGPASSKLNAEYGREWGSRCIWVQPSATARQPIGSLTHNHPDDLALGLSSPLSSSLPVIITLLVALNKILHSQTDHSSYDFFFFLTCCWLHYTFWFEDGLCSYVPSNQQQWMRELCAGFTCCHGYQPHVNGNIFILKRSGSA